MAIILRGSSRQVGVKVGGGAEEELLDCCLFRLKPPGFIISWRLLPRDLDSSLEKVQKLVLSLHSIVGVNSSFSSAHLAADVPSVVLPRDMPSRVVKLWSSMIMCITICSLQKLCSFVSDVH